MFISQNLGRCGHDHMVVEFTTSFTISTFVYLSVSPLNLWIESRSGEVYLIQHYVIKFDSDLRQVSGFLLHK